MKRFVWGIILLVFGILGAFITPNPGVDPNAHKAITIVSAVGGATLLTFGALFLRNRKRTINLAFPMLRERGEIDAFEIARQTGMQEIDVRQCILDGKRQGLLPVDAKIV